MPTTLSFLGNSHCSSLQTAQNLRVLEDSGCEMEQVLVLLAKEAQAGCIEGRARASHSSQKNSASECTCVSPLCVLPFKSTHLPAIGARYGCHMTKATDHTRSPQGRDAKAHWHRKPVARFSATTPLRSSVFLSESHPHRVQLWRPQD